jgi:hypothetical protein
MAKMISSVKREITASNKRQTKAILPCQSCTMPMEKMEDSGTNTEEQMIKKCESIMRQMHVPEAQVEQTKTFIPMLKRWKI